METMNPPQQAHPLLLLAALLALIVQIVDSGCCAHLARMHAD